MKTPIIPRSLAPSAFGDRFYANLTKEEKPVPRIYSDPKGIPSMGVGFALVHRGTDNTFRLMDRRAIDEAISTGKPYTLTDDEYKRLVDATAHLNDGHSEKAKALIPVVPQTSEDVPENNRFGFTIPKDGQRRLIAKPMIEAQIAARKEVEDRAHDKGWTATDIEDDMRTAAFSEEMLGLASVKYNAGGGKKTKGPFPSAHHDR